MMVAKEATITAWLVGFLRSIARCRRCRARWRCSRRGRCSSTRREVRRALFLRVCLLRMETGRRRRGMRLTAP
ncbi:hypothetical protein BC567DRAFT_216877 [Phyllosticta citribraziliensis]